MVAGGRLHRLAGADYQAPPAKPDLNSRLLPLISGAALAGGAVFYYPGRDYVLIGLMLFLPLFDRGWRIPALPHSRSHHIVWAGLLVAGIAILVWQPSKLQFALSALLMAALPEEWFFRAHFMTRIGQGWRANLIASLLFSLLHGLTQGWPAAVRVLAPSLFYGWLYQRTRDLPLLILVHALSNLVFAMFLAQFFADFMGISR